ncbi:hypothetical protein MHYP_G00129410 [Metynnis hypsauchen]
MHEKLDLPQILEDLLLRGKANTVSVRSIGPQLGQQEQPPGFDSCPTPFINAVPVRLGFAHLHIKGLLD